MSEAGQSGWNVLESLILAQAVYKYGDDSWSQIAKVLRGHPAISRPMEFFSPKNCEKQYQSLLADVLGEEQFAYGAGGQDMPPVAKLARKLHIQRIDEIKVLLKEDENEFRELVQEIEEIKNGRWDDRLRAELKEQQQQADAQQTENPPDGAAPMEQTEEESAADTLTGEETPIPESTPMDVDTTETAPPPPTTEAPETTAVKPTSAESLKAEEIEVKESGDRTSPIVTPQEEEEESPAPSIDTMEVEEVEEVKEGEDEEDVENVEAVEEVEEPEIEEFHDAPATADTDEMAVEPKTELEESTINTRRRRSPTRSVSPVKTSGIVTRKGPLQTPRVKMPSVEPESMDADSGAETSDGGGERRRHMKGDQALQTWKKTVNFILAKIGDHRYGNVFSAPVKEEGYTGVVKQPMSLDVVRARVRKGITTTTAEFHRDLLLMFTNAIMYNNEDSEVYAMALEMKNFVDAEVQHLTKYGADPGRERSVDPDIRAKTEEPTTPVEASSSSNIP
ncbi:uncharacterized protein SPPG_08400 [Spizellomyces punctatus DAOM BR117]|uniref:Bromo domain-containing protein n=1 Tax=Spizellomyces punctatus (strain DAOM BR117) TaxID=645134 RepID=A0A0L0H5R3_SPIPD|nr:uncharacterized protein SPPG_08400 [Spizellomyces punctatus DAOM BR117]KNC96246.1 hypothetical protein SPPG_08400 [Spizellomyces punctatus DAOM BR117]|eukprot:XP_016604286.1 hypothetical protein SPPG_08400 [Spizellomyces punctatus DAOM BR117]